MSENDDAAELLFFDTFSHEVDTDINLDLVQFPKPVYITQVRIIPLGARVQADFPGGVRLGATNPSKFNIEFFVNDLGMPGASTFENLGQLEYNQNDCIHLECTTEKIPTDGLVLRGWYSTITLAVYGILTNSMNEPIASPPPPPCEPAAPEEICNLSGDGRNSVMPDEEAKEEWKEPLPGEVVAVAHAHKTTTSDYEREDLDYNITREHYHHSGDERRTRKASHSSEHSVSSRNRTHSESNERDYIRSRSERDGKSSRDWSRSPDYTSRRPRRKRSELSRSDVEEPHKWPPRTPPVSIDSPARPRSPDITEFVDEDDDVRYKLKSRSYMRSSESLINVAQETHVIDDDETPGTPGEQFEPILSDDEIIGDDDSNAAAEQIAADEFEMEIIAAATAAKPAIAEFDAFKSPISKYENDLHSHYSKELENLKLLFKKFELQTKIDSLERFKEATTTVDERENFVYLSEQLINQLSYLTQQFKRRNFVLQQFFKSDARNLRQGFDILQIALDFEAACLQQQPAFKIRHIKVGARLAELFGASAEFFNYLQEQQFEPFTVLFSLYQQNYMALSIKLMLLKAVYALLDTKAGVRHFLGSKLNGYQLVLNTLQQTHLTRTKYALQAIIKKMNLNEALECIRENCTKVFIFSNYQESAYAESYLLIEQAIEQVLDALALNALSFQQPKRFLPVSKKFEIFADAVAQRSFANALQAYFTQHSLGESMLLMFANSAQLPMSLLLRCLDLLETMLKTHIGVDYFVDDCFETTQMLVATLLGIDDVPVEQHDDTTETSDEKTDEFEPKGEKGENETTIASKNAVKSETEENVVDENLLVNKAKCSSPSSIAVADVPGDAPPTKQVLHRMQNLGIELAYKSQTRYHLDAIVFTATSNDYDSIKLASHLHALYSQTCNSLGRLHTIEVIGFNNNLQVFMDLVKKEQRLQAQRQLSSPGAKYKSPVLSYAVDMIDCCVRYCEKLDYLMEHGANLLELAKNHETFEPSVSAVLQEMYVYLKPLETINIFAYDDITPLVEVITRSLEYITTFPGDLIMGLRILRHLAIGPACSSLKSGDTEELKHRFVSLQFYAADGVQTLVQILEKLCSYFEQPGLHSPALMTIQGLHCCQIMLPSLQVLREMLSFAIQSRDVQFKDLTAIDHLMKAYFLMHYFPAANQASKEIELAKNEIIQTLLAYTQPNEQDEESLNKSLWTQMIREILKNIDGPSTFIPGLQVLAELLPLPLPIPLANNTHLMEAQTQRLITERKLWSAHLHPQSLQIAKLIETIAPSSFPPLSDLMKRICVHLADLAPNMTLLISRTLSDSLCTEWSNNAYTPTLHLWRLLHFFSRLTSYATLKSSALSILSGKLWELFQAILTISEPTDIALKCQTSIHIIMKSFLNADISLISPQSACTHEVNLASALPPKELIPRIVDATLTNLVNDSVTPDVSQFAAKNLIMISEHDITCHHLILALKLKRTEIQQWLQKLTQSNEKATNHISIELFLTLLCSLMQIAGDKYDDNSSTPQRTLKLKVADLSLIIGYQKEPATQPHVLQRIRIAYEQDKKNINDALLIDINKLITQLESFEGTTAMELDEDTAVSPEPTLPQAEGIVTQFAARPIFTSFDGTMDADSLLSVRCWLPTLGSVDVPFKFDGKYERVACNLTELSNSCLPPETNLTSDCKRVLHLSASPQSNRERTPTAPCFRTRRVEVEPSTGRPEKKIYITPRGRGFPRAPPSRGDLFRSRPPNTSRPPSLHVDDFLALETCGAQPTGPTGYNKIPTIMRGSRVGRNRGSRISSSVVYRKTKILRTSSPSTWNDGASPHYRTATAEPHFGGGGGESHYSPAHFIGRPRGRARARGYLR